MKLFSLWVLFGFLFLASCNTPNSPQKKKVKNLILMIGDGMGPQQISLLYYYAKYGNNPNINLDNFAFKKISENGSLGLSGTEAHGRLAVDSACSATHLATGHSSLPLFIGKDFQGKSHKTILEKAKAKGMATGLVSDTRLTHATPASFAAHVLNRNDENTIAEQMIQTGPDIMLSGGLRHFIPQGEKITMADSKVAKSKREDSKDLLKMARGLGYETVFSRYELKKVKGTKKILGLFSESGMKNGTWQHQNKDSSRRFTPNLLEMSQAAVAGLSKNKNGFFLMIEGGQIDWAGHRNDTGNMLHEMINFNDALLWVLDWVKKNPETLLVVTADHETGSFAFGYNGRDIPKPFKIGEGTKEEALYKDSYNYGSAKTLQKIYQQKEPLVNTWDRFKDLPKKQQTPAQLRALVIENTGYEFTLNEAKEVLASQRSPYFLSGHKHLGKDSIPKVDDFTANYFSGVNARSALIARKIADEQNVSWGTGGHTATPVPIFTYGSAYYEKRLGRFISHPEVGQILQEALGL